MFILPVENKIDLKKPPLITFILIALNVLIFLFGQHKDEQHIYQAYQYYLSTPLVQQEAELYRDYLQRQGRSSEKQAVVQGITQQSWSDLMIAMQGDEPFQRYVFAYYRTYPKQAEPHRNEFDRLLNASWVYKFGYVPASGGWVNLLMAMFLHGGLMHLIGNMVFLFISGFTVERALGPWRYLSLYFAAGIAGTLLHAVLNSGSVVPLVGASGAVSGLMGAYAAIYRMKQIRFFYWIGIYFDYIRLPASVVLLVWIFKEMYQSKTDEMQQVAYWAHVGGLVAGALCVLLFDLLTKRSSREVLVEEHTPPQQTLTPYERALQRANTCLKNMDIIQAKAILYQLLQQVPHDVTVLEKLYQLEKHQPQSDTFNKIAWRLLAVTEASDAEHQTILRCFKDYVERCGALDSGVKRLPADALLALVPRLLSECRFEEVDILLRQLLLKSALNPTQQAQVPSLMYRMVVALQKQQDPLYQRYIFELKQRFPESQEAIWCESSQG